MLTGKGEGKVTRIIDGIAQPDIVAQRGDETKFIFVETSESLNQNREALKRFLDWYSDKDAAEEYIERCFQAKKE